MTNEKENSEQIRCSGWLCGSTNLIKVGTGIGSYYSDKPIPSEPPPELVGLECQDCGAVSWYYAKFYKDK